MRALRFCPGFLAGLLILCIGGGLISTAWPDEPASPGYYDGDGDDDAAAPERLAVLSDLAASARAAVMPARAPELLEILEALLAPPTPSQSRPALLRSPPSV